MNRSLVSRLVPSLLLCCTFCLTAAKAQPEVVKGTVTASTVPVRGASVTFQNLNIAAQQYSSVTDSLGQYQLSITLTSTAPAQNLPASFKLEQNYPNPFASSTVVPYELTRQAEIQVTIYDILGRVVRRFTPGAQPAGAHSVLWDGRDGVGHRVASGVYLYSLRAGGEVLAGKMVMSPMRGADLPLLQERFSPAPALTQPPAQQLAAVAFTVRVVNTTATAPFIVPITIRSVSVAGDTTINFAVDSLAVVPTSTVNLDSVQQVIRGFGGGNILLFGRPPMTPGQVQSAFGSGPDEAGFSIMRLGIPPTDNPTGFAPMVSSTVIAESLGAIVFATPWTPPAALKTNNSEVGGYLDTASYTAYATHLKGFADYMAANGAPLYAISIQNEPDANVTYQSCYWNATQFLNFTKNNAAAIGMRIIMPESENFKHSLSDSTLNDPAAAANVAIIGGHLYGGGLAPYPLAVAKGKEIWMTEHLDTDTLWAGIGGGYGTGVLATGKEMNDCMNVGMHAYVTWYIARYYGPVSENVSGGLTKRGYVMSQFARFVRPGYHKVKCDPNPQNNVFVTSYADSASAKVVIVALNMGSSVVKQAFVVPKGSAAAYAAYTTSRTSNCAQGNDVAVAGGAFTALMEPGSMTTFVSK